MMKPEVPDVQSMFLLGCVSSFFLGAGVMLTIDSLVLLSWLK